MDEMSYPYGDSRNSTTQMSMSSDWVKYVLDLPMIYEPGKRMTYNSGCTILLAGILKNLNGEHAHQFAQKYLFDHLSINNFNWETGAKGITNTAWGLRLKPRDMMKFGMLYLNLGLWEGKRIISKEWIRTSTKNYVSVSGGFSYGYQWWVMPLDNFPNHTPQPDDIKIAWGYSGQFIFIIPYLNMVVVSTANNPSGDDDQLTIKFLKDYILKAVKN